MSRQSPSTSAPYLDERWHIDNLERWRERCDSERRNGRRIGLVPTMGALHAGHVALAQRAHDRGDFVVMTSFVNPRQFSDRSDLEKYPRTPEHDLELARLGCVDAFVAPTVAAMWPDFPATTATTVSVAGVADRFEGTGRPGHFDGVASVVAKLLVITGPCQLYMGEKDFQQVAVVRQLVRDLGFDVDVISCPTVRDVDGLALSSRNVRLSREGRSRALSLARAMTEVASGVWQLASLRSRLEQIGEVNGVELIYAAVVHPETLIAATSNDVGLMRVLVAIRVDGVRLIDNAQVTLEVESGALSN